MIPFARDLLTKDLGLKVLSVALSALIYTTVTLLTFSDQRQASAPAEGTGKPRVFHRVPVLVVSAAADVRQFRISPDQVDVTVVGDPRTLIRMEPGDIRALVDVTGFDPARDTSRRIELSVPPGVAGVTVIPPRVTVLPPGR